MPSSWVILILLALNLTQCHPAAIQRQESREIDERAIARKAKQIANRQGLDNADATAFEEAVRGSRGLTEPDCDSGSICSYNQVVRCSGTPNEEMPSSLEELVDVIDDARAAGGRIRPAGARHTSNKAICPDGGAAVAVSLRHFETVEINRAAGTVRAGAGLQIVTLMEALEEEGFSLGPAVPFFRGVTVGGALATAAHGSSLTQTSVISSNVLALTLVDGMGRVHVIDNKSHGTLWLAARASMGAFGIVIDATFKVVPSQNGRLTSGRSRDGSLLSLAEPIRRIDALFGKQDFGNLMWFPNAGRYLWTRVTASDAEAPAKASKAAAPKSVLENATLRPHLPQGGMRFALKMLDGMVARRGNCWLERVGAHRFSKGVVGRWDKSNSARRRKQGAGAFWRMVTSDVLTSQEDVPQLDFEFAFPIERMKDVLEVARSFDAEDLCLPLVGVFLRFSEEPSSPTTLIGHSAVRPSGNAAPDPAKVMFFEFVVYAPRGARGQGSRYLAGYRQVANRLLDLGGWPHWAKNDEEILARHQLIDPVYAERLERFRWVAECLDPEGVFSSAFAEKTGLRYAHRKAAEGCAELLGGVDVVDARRGDGRSPETRGAQADASEGEGVRP